MAKAPKRTGRPSRTTDGKAKARTARPQKPAASLAPKAAPRKRAAEPARAPTPSSASAAQLAGSGPRSLVELAREAAARRLLGRR